MPDLEEVAAFISTTEYRDLPNEVLSHAKLLLRDNVGVTLAGSTLPLGDVLTGYVGGPADDGDATVIGRGRADALDAALANGAFSLAMAWSDAPGGTHNLSHPSSPIVPAALAAAETDGSSGRDLLTGYVVGYEVMTRVEQATDYRGHFFRGWHNTGTFGVFGAAAAAASVFGLTGEEIRRALGIAATVSSGLRKNNGTMARPFLGGHAAQEGLRAAMLAREGLTANESMLHGPTGYCSVYSPGEHDPSVLSASLGDEWNILQFGFKPFPGLAVTHGAQVALLGIVERHDLRPDDVESITVTLHEGNAEILPVREPSDPYETQESIEFSLATILRERTHGIEQFTPEYVTGPETKRAMGKVQRDFGFDGDEYDLNSARVVVRTSDGEEHTSEELYSPLQVSVERLDEKFYDCARSVTDGDEAERLDELVTEIDSDGALEATVALLDRRRAA